MTATLPTGARETFDRFITCELTTIGARQQPITWPVTPYYGQGDRTIDVTTGLGYPKKADDAARHPKVSLLFSDPTGSGLKAPPQVLVQGTAEVDDRDLDANRERYWRESAVKLPATKEMHPPKPLRRLFNWYYTRIYIRVRPERVFIWPAGDPTGEPELHDAHLEEVRSGHTEEPPEDHGPTDAGEPVWDSRLDQLATPGDAVVSWLAPDGFPAAVRLPVRADPDSRSISVLAEPTGIPMLEGRTCLTVHSHAPDFSWQRNFQVRGHLAREGGGWRLTPRKLVGGFELPDESELARYRRNLGKSIRFYRTARRRMREPNPKAP